jgi:hypothetical protein
MDNMKRRHLIGCSAVLMALTTTAVWGQDDARRVRYDDYRVVDVQIDDTQDVRTMEALDAGLLADGVIVGGLNKYMVPPDPWMNSSSLTSSTTSSTRIFSF